MDKEESRLYNFLKHYNLEQYYDGFVKLGVVKVAHLKDVDDHDLTEIGMQRPEKIRLKKKVEENFSTMGKFKKKISGKEHKFISHPEIVPPAATGQSGHNLLAPNTNATDHKNPILINPKDIKLGRKLGEGANGAVHEATLTKENGLVSVAVKTIYTKEKGLSLEAMFIKEAQSMAQLNHKHIIKLFGLVLGNPLMLVEELAPFGDLLTYIKTEIVHLGMMHTYAVQLSDAMQYLESLNIVHRDLATRNVLLINDQHAMLSDFGLARVIKDGSVYQTSSDIALPTSWLAPEALSEGKFSSASDVWSFGVLLWELTSLGGRPWEGLKPVEIYRKLEFGERLPRPKLCYPKLYEVMKSCWINDPVNRPKFADINNLLLKKQYLPDKVRVVMRYVTKENVVLKENDFIYIIDRLLEGANWLGMTTEGKVVTFQDAVVTFVPKVTEGNDEQRYHVCKKLTSPNYLKSDLPELPTIHDDDDDPYLTMKPAAVSSAIQPVLQSQPSSSSLLDTESPFSECLPSPINPTTENVQFALNVPSGSPLELFDPLKNSSQKVTATNTSTVTSENQLRNKIVSQYSYLSEMETLEKQNYIHPNQLQNSSSFSPYYVQISDNNTPVNETSSPPPVPPRTPKQSFETKPDSSSDALEKLRKEFPDMNIAFLQKVLVGCEGNFDLAIERIKVDQLLGFGLPYINEEDCLKALKHCQGKVDRAGAWLLEQNEIISNRKKLSV